MKYISLALKTFIAVMVVFGIACFIYAIKETKEDFDRISEDARITNKYKEESFNKLCDFAENNLDELIEFSDNYISLLSPENTAGHAIYIEAEGDMQEFRDKLFDNVFEGYAFIDIYDEKRVVYTSAKGGFTEYIYIFEDGNSIPASYLRELSSAKEISNRVFVFSIKEDH